MCILEKELKKKDKKKNKYTPQRNAYKPRNEKFFLGKNDKREPVPSYRTFI